MTKGVEWQVPVRHRAVWRRLNRLLARRGQELVVAETSDELLRFGRVRRQDRSSDRVFETRVDVERMARTTGVLRPSERIAVRRIVRRYAATKPQPTICKPPLQFELALVLASVSPSGRIQADLVVRGHLGPADVRTVAPKLTVSSIEDLLSRLGWSPERFRIALGLSAAIGDPRRLQLDATTAADLTVRLRFGWLQAQAHRLGSVIGQAGISSGTAPA